jgi:hypothetical protein
MVVAWSTFGPHAIGAERFVAVSSGTSFAQVAGAILGKRARGQNPDKDEVPRFKSWQAHQPFPQLTATPAHHRRWSFRGCPGSCHPRAGVRELSGAMIPMLD